MKYYISKDDSSIKENYYCRLGNYNDSLFLLNYLNKGEIFVDIGANVGHFTLLVSGILPNRTISVEPVKHSFNRLVSNIQLNNLKNVDFHNLALSSSKGELKITNNKGELNKVSIFEEDEFEFANAITLDELLKNEKNLSVIKIDVEGYEKFVLMGGMETLQKKELNVILIELNGLNKYYGYEEIEIIKMLKKHNFSPFRYIPDEKSLIQLSGKNKINNNTLFIRNNAIVQERLAKRTIYFHRSKIQISQDYCLIRQGMN